MSSNESDKTKRAEVNSDPAKPVSFFRLLKDDEDIDEAIAIIKKLLEEAKLQKQHGWIDFKLYL